jgi:hypothetical protein
MLPRCDPTEFLEAFSQALKGTDKTIFMSLYNEKAQISIDGRSLGQTGMCDFLRLQMCEFTPESYTYLPLPGGSTLVNGICIWGNQSSCFTFVLRSNPDDPAHSIQILHQMIVKSA